MKHATRMGVTGAGTLLLKVDDIDRAASDYAALGLRTVRRTKALLIVELPCGMHLVLFRPWGGPRAAGVCLHASASVHDGGPAEASGPRRG